MNETLRKVQMTYLLKLESDNNDNAPDDPYSDVVLVSVTSNTVINTGNVLPEKFDDETAKSETIFTVPTPTIDQNIDAAILQIMNDTDETDTAREVNRELNESKTIENAPVAELESAVTSDVENTSNATKMSTANATTVEKSAETLQQNDDQVQDPSFSEVFSDNETVSDCSPEESLNIAMEDPSVPEPEPLFSAQSVQVNPLKRKDDSMELIDDLNKKQKISDDISPLIGRIESKMFCCENKIFI